MLYCHRQTSDCGDVEIVSPLAPIDRQGLIAAITAVNPKGMTPINLSIDTAVEAARSAEGKTTIVLVSDLEETCEGDPCGAARRAKVSGARVVIDVIGFDVSDEERAQPACIAEAAGGHYRPVTSASEPELAARAARSWSTSRRHRPPTPTPGSA